jgi:hypothetical protein
LPAPGNHEYQTAGAAGYFGYFGSAAGDPTQGYYSYNLGDWHIVVLNSNSDCTTISCSASSAQVQWLVADLAANPKTCTLAYGITRVSILDRATGTTSRRAVLDRALQRRCGRDPEWPRARVRAIRAADA